MSGIAKIRQRMDDTRSGNTTFAPGKEVWLKDGEQMFISSVATGDPDDLMLDDFRMYTFRKDNRWTSVLQDDAVDQSEVPSDVNASKKFAFWAFVYEIIHEEKKNDEWEAIQQQGSNKQMFKETVNDFRIIALSFGRNGYIWNQLEEVYEDWGNRLDKGIIRIKRTGAGLDTAYSISGTSRELEIPEDKMAEIEELDSIKEYFLSHYGGVQEESTKDSTKTGGLGDLF